MNQEDHITRVPELGGAVACNGDHLRPHAPSDVRQVVQEIGGRRGSRGGVGCGGRAALPRRLAPRSSFSSFSGFVGRMRRFARTRSKMTFMYIASCSSSGDDETIVRS